MLRGKTDEASSRVSGSPLEAVASVRGTAPLSVHFALLNPPGAGEPISVPRVLLPAGAFVTVEVRGAAGVAWSSPKARVGGLKLDPDAPTSYVDLPPGYSWGALVVFDGAFFQPGDYMLRLEYESTPYDGPAHDRPLRLKTTVPFNASGDECEGAR